MFGFRTMPSSATRCSRSSWNVMLQHARGDLVAAVDVVIAIHQHFRLDDRHDLRGLAQRGVARQRMGVDADRRHARDAGALMSITARHFAKRAP